MRLHWRDRSADEARFRVEVNTPEGPAGGPLRFAAEATEGIVGGLTPGVPATFRVRAENALGVSDWSAEASATPPFDAAGPCAADDLTLCLLGGRFAVRAVWRDQHNGGTGVGHALPFSGSNRTGLFWFFNPANVELIVKNLDGRTVNGAFWSFYGALSDVEYWVTVTDTAEGRSRTYHNPPGEICGVGDTGAFPESAPLAEGEAAASAGWPAEGTDLVDLAGVAAVPTGAASGTCVPGAETLCLLDGRFAVEVDWHDQHNGGSGRGQAVPGTDKSGFFWFFSPTNLELVTKMLDATSVNGHFWVFWGALSDVEYTITVTDTVTGTPRTYHNPPGEICGGADTGAF